MSDDEATPAQRLANERVAARARLVDSLWDFRVDEPVPFAIGSPAGIVADAIEAYVQTLIAETLATEGFEKLIRALVEERPR